MSLKIARSSVVCVEAELLGDIEIGERSVIHPKARIIAEKGSIVIGNDNLIEETAVIKNVNEETLYIGNENIFEVQSQFVGAKCGDRNIFEVRSSVVGDLTVGNGCVFGAKTNYERNGTVPDKTVVYTQDGCVKKRVASQQPGENSAHITFLHRIMPNYHYLKKQQK